MTPFRRLAVTLHATVVAIFTDTALQLAITPVQTGIGVRANIHLGSNRVLPEWRTQIVCSRPDSVGGPLACCKGQCQQLVSTMT